MCFSNTVYFCSIFGMYVKVIQVFNVTELFSYAKALSTFFMVFMVILCINDMLCFNKLYMCISWTRKVLIPVYLVYRVYKNITIVIKKFTTSGDS